MLLSAGGYQPRVKRPLVYVYELPPTMTSWCERLEGLAVEGRVLEDDGLQENGFKLGGAGAEGNQAGWAAGLVPCWGDRL